MLSGRGAESGIIVRLMEPLAHTLAGACLAETGLRRVTPLAGATLVLSATIADIDGACYLHSADLAFGLRRGVTHGVAAWFVLPVLVTALMLAWDRFVRRRLSPTATPVRPAPLFWLALAGVLTHPALDWVNSYGIRLLMPFSNRWFYGDTLFIVDPWLWLLLGAAVIPAWTARRRGAIVWAAVGTGAAWLVVSNAAVSAPGRGIWLAGLAGLVALRLFVPPGARPRLAKIAAVLALGYVAAMYGESRIAERRAAEFAATRGWTVARVAAMPLPVDALKRVVIVETPERYVLITVEWPGGVVADAAPQTLERWPPHPAVDAVLALPRLQGTRQWLRFPSFEVQPRPDGGFRVIIRDARFAVGTPKGFGVIAVVDVDRDLRPLTSS